MPLSVSPGESGFPTECKQGTNSPVLLIISKTAVPTRVIMSILHTTYAESVNSIPFLAIAEPTGPIENGMMYIVRPFIQPLYKPFIVVFNSAGSIQLFVGPAFSLSRLAI